MVVAKSLTVRRIEVNEGALGYLTQRARLVAREKITVQDNKMRKRAVLVVIDAAQFWVQDALFQSNEADEDSVLVYAHSNRLMTQQTDFRGRSFSSKELISYFEQSFVTQNSVSNKGKLITLIDSNLELTDVRFYQNEQIYDDSYGIVAIYSDLAITNCEFTGPTPSNFLTKLYYPKIKDVYGGFLSIQDRSQV